MKACSGLRKKISGFTLIEVMVALMIVGLALPALMVSISSVVDNTGRMEKRTYAGWIAQNKLQEIMLTKELQNEIPKTKLRDNIEYGGHNWDWEVDVTEQETIVGKVFRFDIKVGEENAEDGEWLVVLSGFTGEE